MSWALVVRICGCLHPMVQGIRARSSSSSMRPRRPVGRPVLFSCPAVFVVVDVVVLGAIVRSCRFGVVVYLSHISFTSLYSTINGDPSMTVLLNRSTSCFGNAIHFL